jgi:hypothetical protein
MGPILFNLASSIYDFHNIFLTNFVSCGDTFSTNKCHISEVNIFLPQISC